MKFSEMPYHRADIATACAEIAEVTAAVPNAASADVLMEMYRRMCEIAGMTVTRLVRVSEGTLQLGDLPRGKWRHLTEREVELLRK